jgi:hypothetical protein
MRQTEYLRSGCVGLCQCFIHIHAIELTDTRDDATLDVVFGNAIGFNDLRGTESQLLLTPEALDTVNDISRNPGDNRGQGLHPSLFGPGG